MQCIAISDANCRLMADDWFFSVTAGVGRLYARLNWPTIAFPKPTPRPNFPRVDTSTHRLFLYGDRRCSNAYNFKSKQHKIISLIQQDSLMLYGGQTQFLVQSAANVSHRAAENVATARVIRWHQLWDSIAGCPSCELHAVQCPTVFIYTYFAVCTEAGYTMPNLQIACI